MRPASAVLREAVKYSHTLRCWVDFYQGTSLVPAWSRSPVTAGKLTSDRTSSVRTNCDLSLAIPEWEALPVDCNSGRFRVYRGLGSLGYTEVLQLGEFRVDEIERPATGVVTINGSGLESYIVDARFLSPRTPPYGSSTIETIQNLIREVLPNAQFRIRATRNKRITATATYERDRRDALDSLAASIGAEVYVDATGTWVIADIPDPTSGAPVFIVDEGNGGVLVDRSEQSTRDRVYNAAVVIGRTVNSDIAPSWGWAADLDPGSPTYFYGPFGQKPIFYSSQFFTSDGQCAAYAQTLLIEALAQNVTLSFDQVPIDFLETGDLVGVRDRRGELEPLLLQKFSLSLAAGGAMSCETLSSKALIADGV